MKPKLNWSFFIPVLLGNCCIADLRESQNMTNINQDIKFSPGTEDDMHHAEDLSRAVDRSSSALSYIQMLMDPHLDVHQKATNPCAKDPILLTRYLQFSILNFTTQTDLSDQCKKDVSTFFRAFMNQEIWTLKLLDSQDMLPGSGWLLDGNFLHYPGNEDECIKQTESIAPFDLTLFTLSLKANQFPCPSGLGMSRFGKCLPSSCSSADIKQTSDSFINNLATNLQYPTEFKTSVMNKNYKGEEPKVTWGDVFMIIICAVIAAIVLVSTVLDILEVEFGIGIVRPQMLQLLQGFSIYTNCSKLFNTERKTDNPNIMSCLDGLRAISISWVVVGHTLFEMCGFGLLIGNGYLTKNPFAYAQENGALNKVYLTPFWNGMFSVDTFFLMGALLLAFHTLKEMDKLKDKPMGHWIMFWGVFYLHRYIRLTAVYVIVIGAHATFLKSVATGPLSYLVLKQAEKCQQGWWYNLLYINNFLVELTDVSTDYNCMGWTWYMANDMQFFIITPILLLVLWKYPYPGMVLCSLLLMVFTAIPFSLTWVDRDQYFHGDQEDFYVKPWNRFQPYLIGLMFGFVLHNLRHKKEIKLSIPLNLIFWMVSGALASSVVYGVYPYNPVHDPTVMRAPNEPPREDRAFYNGFSKLSWSFALCWVIFACIKGKGGVVNKFLSWGFWSPLAKLSYCIYLVQYTIIYWYNSQYPSSQVYTNTLYFYTCMGNLAICVAVALFLHLVFELPLAHAEKILFGLLGIGRKPSTSKRNVSKEKTTVTRI